MPVATDILSSRDISYILQVVSTGMTQALVFIGLTQLPDCHSGASRNPVKANTCWMPVATDILSSRDISYIL